MISLRKLFTQRLFRQERGHHGHAGRPGKVGGSLPGHGGSSQGGSGIPDKRPEGGWSPFIAEKHRATRDKLKRHYYEELDDNVQMGIMSQEEIHSSLAELEKSDPDKEKLSSWGLASPEKRKAEKDEYAKRPKKKKVRSKRDPRDRFVLYD